MESVDYLTREIIRLIGDVKGKRILELGIARSSLCAALTALGATTILVEESKEKLDALRKSQDSGDQKFEMRQSELADLAFCPAQSIDIAVSVIALSGTKDLARVFRQLQRVLKDQGAFIFGLIHPLAFLTSGKNDGKALSPYGSKETVESCLLQIDFPVPLPKHVRSISFGETFALLKRAGFGLDHLVEMGESQDGTGMDVLLVKAHK